MITELKPGMEITYTYRDIWKMPWNKKVKILSVIKMNHGHDLLMTDCGVFAESFLLKNQSQWQSQ